MPVICAMAQCQSNKAKHKNLIMHTLPRDKNMRRKWIQACRRADLKECKHWRVCSLHFLESDYKRDLKNELLGLLLKKELKYDAIPKINLPVTSVMHKKSDVIESPRQARLLKREKKRNLQAILEEPLNEHNIYISAMSHANCESNPHTLESEKLISLCKKVKMDEFLSEDARHSSCRNPDARFLFEGKTFPSVKVEMQDTENDHIEIKEEPLFMEYFELGLDLPSEGENPVQVEEEKLDFEEDDFECKEEPLCADDSGLLLDPSSEGDSSLKVKEEKRDLDDGIEVEAEPLFNDDSELSTYLFEHPAFIDKRKSSDQNKTPKLEDAVPKIGKCFTEHLKFVETEKGSLHHNPKVLSGDAQSKFILQPCSVILKDYKRQRKQNWNTKSASHPSSSTAVEHIHCPKLLSTPPLSKHQTTPTDEKLPNCKQCGKNFSIQSHVYRHLRIHTGEKPFACKRCQRNFSSKNSLVRHERTHTGERPYECNVCGKKFAQDSTLKRHLVIHTGEKSYQCKDCMKKFFENSSLVKHLRVHTGEKPYHCKLCGNRFSQNSSLIKHQRIHTGEQPYQCEECGKKFRYKTTFKKHLQTHT